MKRTTIREIYVEIETIRVTKKRSVREKTPVGSKDDDTDRERSVNRTLTVLEQNFKRFLG